MTILESIQQAAGNFEMQTGVKPNVARLDERSIRMINHELRQCLEGPKISLAYGASLWGLTLRRPNPGEISGLVYIASDQEAHNALEN